MAAGMGQIEFRILGRSSEERLSDQLEVPGIDPQLEGEYTSNCTMTVRDSAAASGGQLARARSSKAGLNRRSRNPDLPPRPSGLSSASGIHSSVSLWIPSVSLRVRGAYRLDSESIGVKPFEKGRYDWSADQLALQALQRTVTMQALRLATHRRRALPN
jgi:hypothetical protein